MTHPDRDAELEAWLRRSSSLHAQLARLDRSDPPEELDRIVLDRAREAIRAPRAVGPLRQMRWAVPLGLAATLILSFALLLQIGPSPKTTRSAPAENATIAQQVFEASEDKSATEPSVVGQPIEIAPPEPRMDAPASPTIAPPPTRPPQTNATAKRELAQESASAAQGSLDAAQPMAAAADVRKDADAWLAQIEKLRAQGRIAEAERELSEFKRAYPERGTMPAAAPPPEER